MVVVDKKNRSCNIDFAADYGDSRRRKKGMKMWLNICRKFEM